MKNFISFFFFFSYLSAAVFTDHFSTDTSANYTLSNTWTAGGIGSFVYDDVDQRMQVSTGDNIALLFSHTLSASTEGSFSLDFLPTAYYPNGGVITLKLIQNASTYYQIENTDNYGAKALSKYVNGVIVDSQSFNNEFTQNLQYTIHVDFSPASTSVQAFGQTITINNDATPITVSSFSLETTQQDAFYDNIIYDTAQSHVNIPPTADAGGDRSVQVNQTISIMGTGNDSDGNIISYEWKKGTTTLANTATFDYTPDTIGTDTLTLIVTDNNGSTATDSMNVTVTSDVVQASEVIIDNLDAGFSSTGTWAESIANDEYAQSSLYSRTLGSSATWRPTLLATGLYEVYVWYSGSIYGNRDSQAQYTVNYSGGSQTVSINQNQGSGAWVSLGVFAFDAGTTGDVTLVSYFDGGDSVTIADAVRFVPASNIYITTPLANHIQSNNTLLVKSSVSTLPNGGGVAFILDENTPLEITKTLHTPPYETTFTNVTKDEHTIDAYIIDASDNIQSGTENHFSVQNIAIGDIYVAFGDSITNGYGDTLSSDNISQDGRNDNRGYPPILNDKLTSLKGYPHSIINEGIPAETIQEALNRLPDVIALHPEAMTYLILTGTNNTSIFSPQVLESGKGLNIGDFGYTGTYKDYMQQIIDLLNDAGKEIVIAKIPVVLGTSSSSGNYTLPITGNEARNVKTNDFNSAIDELTDIPSNNIILVAPDFYTYYKDHYTNEYFDNLHPNGLGYQSMANLWKDTLTQ